VSCAIELLDGALARGEGNTYEALVAQSGPPDDALVAYACFGATPMTEGTFDLYWLVVAEEARGRGMGRGLLTAVEDELRGRRGRLLRIETSSLEGQGGAARFYAQSGYRQVGLVSDFYRPGDDLITFAKVL
jgi:GNAT superfamily N-acetyltransferase